jgi:carbonic anhydrase/acetyltransferase-like protein (isoleucine patch superfamily)
VLLPHRDILPRIASCAFIEASARIIGDVEIGNESSVWFNVVIRGDVNRIRIGHRTNVQDGTVIHVARDTHPTIIGDEVTIGHQATLHGCTVGDRCLIGIGAVLLNGVVIGEESMVAAGALLSPGTRIPPRTLVMGAPGRSKRSLTPEEISRLSRSAANYVRLRLDYMDMSIRSS